MIITLMLDAQAGFRMNMATIDNRLVLYDGIHYMLNDDSELYVTNIEFTKAFDYDDKG